MSNFLIVVGLLAVASFISFCCGFMFCQWGHDNGLAERHEDRKWQANEWN